MPHLPELEDIEDALIAEGRPLDSKELADLLGVARGARRAFKRQLEDMVVEGRVKALRGGLFRAVGRRREEVYSGVLTVNPRGFGFVAIAGQPDDVFVPEDALAGAMHRDQVEVAIVGRSSRGPEGRIASILERRSARVAGVLRRRGRSTWLEPDDTRIRGPVVLAAGTRDGADGEAAVAVITQFPASPQENPEGELLTVLGAPGDPNVEVAKILVRENVQEAHPPEAAQEAEKMAARLRHLGELKRVDLRDVPLPTIDPEDARDHDDAVWAERQGEGYRVWVAIADVSEYVQPGTALDTEARERGCTIYLPDRAIPMLPAALASDLCSLLPDTDRLCLCAIVDLDKQGKVKRSKLVEGLMRSQARLTYGGVARALGFTEAPPKSAQAEAFKRDLKVLEEVSRKLRRARMKRGALDFDLPEARIELDPETGAPVNVYRRTQDPGVKRAYQIVEEMMLLANEVVATWLGRRKCPAIYRVHAKPDEAKLEKLGAVAQQLGVQFDFDSMQDALGVSKWLKKVDGHPRQKVLEMLMLRSLKQAAYDPTNIGHFGLASKAYVHFTSPIRRYPDLTVHRAVKHLLRGGKPDISAEALETLGHSAVVASQRERAAMEVEREVADLYRVLYLRDHIGLVCSGSVSAIVGSGLYVTLEQPFVDVLVRWESLGPDRYESDDDGISVFGVQSGDRIQLGDDILVEIEDVAVLRRTAYARRIPPERVVGDEPKRGRRGRRAREASQRDQRQREKAGRKETKRATKKKARAPRRR